MSPVLSISFQRIILYIENLQSSQTPQSLTQFMNIIKLIITQGQTIEISKWLQFLSINIRYFIMEQRKILQLKQVLKVLDLLNKVER